MTQEYSLAETAISDCCQTTEDGASVCLVPENGQMDSCGCKPHTDGHKSSFLEAESTNRRTKGRSGLLFIIACLASPCCTPLYVPLALVLLAGTPPAVWLSARIGWVYGGLTLVSVVSLVLAFRWWPKALANHQPNQSKIHSAQGAID